ncbi:MAG TPA: DNA polymerase III subunit delta [Dehalococcoidia bacterium]|nr:DNA polymerase III subunit delta [Dehalococcoidia bacterium]
MPSFKPAYLVHGDDHGRIGERRSRLRAIAERESGAHGVEVFEGDASTPEAIAVALSAMTFAIGRRFIIADGVERWREKELEPVESALAAMPPETTVAFFAREEARAKVPARLHDAVRHAGGDVSAEESVKPWELPKWVIAQAKQLDLKLEPDAARALIGHVGDRQQRLLRELEKLALEAGAETEVSAEEIGELTAASAERRAWTLADALVAGESAAAVRIYLALRAQGERVPGLLYWMSQRLRTAHEVAQAIEAGEAAAQIKRRLRMPSRAADRLIGDARNRGAERLREALVQIADLELAARGGGSGAASEDTEALRTIVRIAA